MLERLNEIDWSSLHHAYGPASDVPDQIRALTSASNGERNRALYELFGNIWHQGTRSVVLRREATSAAQAEILSPPGPNSPPLS